VSGKLWPSILVQHACHVPGMIVASVDLKQITSLHHYAVPWTCSAFFFSLAQNRRVPLQNLLWLQNLTETNCFADVKIFHVYLIQIYFEYKYLQELWFLDWNTEGFKSIGFDIPLYASLNVRNLHFWLRLAKKRREPLFFMYSTLFGLFSLLLTLWLPG